MHRLGFLALLPLFLTTARADDSPFLGTIVYEQVAAGESEGAKAFRGLAASKISVHFGSKAYRQDEVGGMFPGSVIVNYGARPAIRLDHTKKTSEGGGANDLEQSPENMRAFMPWNFKTAMEPTGKQGTICGYDVAQYKVTKSAFMRPGATMHIWVAPRLQLPRHRYQFEFKASRAYSPLPISIPVAKGAILKVEVLENETPVTITATAVQPGEPAATLFAKPEGYDGPELAAPAKPPAVKTAPAKPPVDISKLPPEIENGIGMKLVLIKPGTFQMGSPAGEPSRRDDEGPYEVTLSHPYYAAIHEVTQAQWKAVMGTDSPSHFKGDNLPVEKVTWNQAVEFCTKLSAKEGRTYRLPTEAEWEYAARAGGTIPYASRKLWKAWLLDHAWMSFNAKYKSHAVGTLKPNAWGLFDTIGNVGEWTASGYGPYPQGKVRDPLGVDSNRKAVRGQGWVSSYDFCRFASRSGRAADKSKSTIGFRVVCDPK